MFSINLLVPIIIAFVSDVYHPDCSPYKKGENIGDFRTGSFCNISSGPTVIYIQGSQNWALSNSGHTLLVTQRDLISILKTNIGSQLIDVSFYGGPISIFMKFVKDLDSIREIRSKYAFNHLVKSDDGCARNGFFSFNIFDTVEVASYPYNLTIKFGEPIGVFDESTKQETLPPKIKTLIRDKRSLTCEGGGIGVGYGLGVTVVGVAVKTWCDTSNLEFSLNEKYNKKFDQLALSTGKSAEDMKASYKLVEGMLKELEIGAKDMTESLKTHTTQVDVLKQDFANLQQWFKNENSEISYKLNWMGSHLQYEVMMMQVNTLYNELLTRLTTALNLWSSNSKNNNCLRYDKTNPGQTVKFETLLGMRKISIDNIDLKGKLTHIFEFMKSANEIQTNLTYLTRKGIYTEQGLLLSSEHGYLGTMEAMKGLIDLNQEALNHLVMKDAPWKRTVRIIIQFVTGFTMWIGGLMLYLNLKTEHYSHNIVIRKIEFLHVLMYFALGFLIIFGGVLDLI